MTRKILSVVSIAFGLALVVWTFLVDWPGEEGWPEAFVVTYGFIGGVVQFGVGVGLTLHLLLTEIKKAKDQRVGSPTCIGMVVAFNIGWVMAVLVLLAFYWSSAKDYHLIL